MDGRSSKNKASKQQTISSTIYVHV